MAVSHRWNPVMILVLQHFKACLASVCNIGTSSLHTVCTMKGADSTLLIKKSRGAVAKVSQSSCSISSSVICFD